MKKTYVHVALFSSLILWASSFPGIEAGLGGYSPFQLAALRFTVASVLLAGLAPWVKVRRPPTKDLPLILALAFFGVACYHLAINYGELKATSSTAAFITNVSPVFTMLIAQLFLGEELRRRSWIGVGVSLAGVWLVASAHGGSVSAGIGAAVLLGAALCWSLFFVLQKPLLTYYRPLEVTCYSVWIGTLFLGFLIPDSLAMSRNAPWPATLSAIYLGLFPTALAYVSWSYVLAHMPASRASAYTYVIPPLSTAIAVVWVNETPSAFFLIGGVAILAGVAIATESAAR
jgi:drug/metabolite transporter (DMT)-like permease